MRPACRRILIVNPFGIGDVLFSTPLIRALRRAVPEAHLAYLCNRRTEPILRRNHHLNELFVYEKDELLELWRRDRLAALKTMWGLFAAIRRQRFDLAVDLSLGERFSFFLSFMGVPRRVGFDYRRRGRFLTFRLPMNGFQNAHVTDYYARLLRTVGIHMLDRELELPPTRDDLQAAESRLTRLGLDRHPLLIGMVPAGGVSWGQHAAIRRWPQEGFLEVARQLRSRHRATILLFGEPPDQPVCAEIAQALGEGVVDLSGQTGLGEFVGLLGRCRLIISNDGGPLHIAVSQRVPTVSIFGPVDPQVYGPYPSSIRHRVICREDLLCRPCYAQFRMPPCPYERACLQQLGADQVLAACEDALAAGDRPIGPSCAP